MGMGMSMGYGLRLRQLCVICNQDMDDHAESCPQGRMQALMNRRIIHKCPDCYDWTLEKNREDYLECRKCREVFTIGLCAPYDVEKLPRVIVFTRDDQALNAARFPKKGNGDFPIDDTIKALSKSISKARKEARKRNRE